MTPIFLFLPHILMYNKLIIIINNYFYQVAYIINLFCYIVITTSSKHKFIFTFINSVKKHTFSKNMCFMHLLQKSGIQFASSISQGASKRSTLYILASDFFEKAFKYVFIVFFETNQMIIHICTSEILKLAFKTGFSVHNIHLYLCWQVENTKWILCFRKIVLNVQYLRFLMYKINLMIMYYKINLMIMNYKISL